MMSGGRLHPPVERFGEMLLPQRAFPDVPRLA